MNSVKAAIFLIIIGASSISLAQDPEIEVDAAFTPEVIREDENVTLEVRIRIPEGFILYSMTPVQDGPLPLVIKTDNSLLEPSGHWTGTAPKVKLDPGFEKNVEYHVHSASYKRSFKIAAGTVDGGINLSIDGQICDDRSCYTQKKKVWAPLEVEEGSPRRAFERPARLEGEIYSPKRQVGAITVETETNDPSKIGLAAFILMAILAGFGALLTPCVFPMIPITISYFSKYHDVSLRRNLLMASVYAGSIILVYSVPGVVLTMLYGADFMQVVSTHPMFNVFVTTMLVLFGLNLLGAFEIRLPNWLVSRSAQLEQDLTQTDHSGVKKQVAEVFFMAVTFTLVSFSCTVGFVGGWVLPLAHQGDAFYPLIGMVAFSSAFALPFFLLAVFPAAASKLQGKAGDWMLAVKAFFGIVELAAALKFLSNLDLHFELGLLTRSVVLITWTALFLGTALFVLKVFSFRKGRAFERPGVTRIVIALVLLIFAAKSFTGIGNERPMGGMIDGWLPPVPYPDFDAESEVESELHLEFMKDDFSGAMEAAKENGKPLFVDFTGFQCANCRLMESAYFPKEAIRERLKRMVRVKVFTDGPRDVHKEQREYQIERFKTAVLPFYVVLDPVGDELLGSFSSMANTEREFVEFLDAALAKFEKNRDLRAETKTDERRRSPKNPRAVTAGLNAIGDPLEFQLPDLFSGERMALSSLRGKWVFVNLWASWCAPCKKELREDIPAALELAPAVKLMTVAFDGDETVSNARVFIEEAGLMGHMHLVAGADVDEAPIPDEMRETFAMPSSFLLDPEGRIAWRKAGSVDRNTLVAVFNSIGGN